MTARVALRHPLLAAIWWLRALVLLASLGLGGHAQAQSVLCHGRFPNPITDICWQCIFPISIGGFALGFGQEDIENPGSPICLCPMALPPWVRIGLEIGFWEPARIIESTRTPYCFPALGGIYVGPTGGPRPPGARATTAQDGARRDSFYQAHMYVNPILYYLEVLIDASCLEVGSFDLAYMSEFDPAWHDDNLTAILEPEAPLFANLLAIAACSADCVAASVGFGFEALFWCSGCNGGVYPMNGNVPVHIGGIQASSLINHRLLARMHRIGVSWQTHGALAVCGSYPQPMMDKRGYKTQMIYPVPMTGGTDGSGPNRCCQPLGRTTQIWGMGREFPIAGEDFAYQVFRKKNCCLD